VQSALRPGLATITAALLLAAPASAFQTPLSDEAIREAYFLGQRRDESMARLLNSYTKFLPAPASGPHIYSVTFLTPFALVVQYSSSQINYSAQDAEKDHHPDDEIVSIQIAIALTQSYGPIIAKPTGSRSGSPTGFQLRSPDFWRAFKYRIFDGDEEITTDDLSGEPQYQCSDSGCTLSGATVRLQFPATAFASDSATIEVTPPEGDPVSVDFDLVSLR
jgi:hypothetical protein